MHIIDISKTEKHYNERGNLNWKHFSLICLSKLYLQNPLCIQQWRHTNVHYNCTDFHTLRHKKDIHIWLYNYVQRIQEGIFLAFLKKEQILIQSVIKVYNHISLQEIRWLFSNMIINVQCIISWALVYTTYCK